jgi:hypothetical protein
MKVEGIDFLASFDLVSAPPAGLNQVWLSHWFVRAGLFVQDLLLIRIRPVRYWRQEAQSRALSTRSSIRPQS